MDQCECCRGLRGHMRLKDLICEEFEGEYTNAQLECQRLSNLFKDVCWYNFETKCRTWQNPWPMSWEGSDIELHGVSIEVDRRNGRDREIGHFPVYYRGSIRDAPPLPPEILLKELKDASDYLKFTQQQITAAHDWAPGGKLYQQLLKETCVPTEYSKRRGEAQEVAARISKRVLDGGDAGEPIARRARHQQRNRLERATKAAAKATT